MISQPLSRREIWITLLCSFAAGTCLSLVLTYLLYFASPGNLMLEICDTMAVPSGLSMHYFPSMLFSASFETVVNSSFYTLFIFSISLLYRKLKPNQLR
jgi:hypothetical protein